MGNLDGAELDAILSSDRDSKPKKKKKKRHRSNVDSSDYDSCDDWDASEFELRIKSYSITQLRTAERSALRAIDVQKQKEKEKKREKKREIIVDSESETEEDMEDLTMDE